MIFCGLLPEFSCCQREEALSLMDSPERLSGRTVTAGSSGKFTPSTIMWPVSEEDEASTEIRLGVLCFFFLCAQGSTSHPPRVLCERGPPKRADRSQSTNRVPAFDAWVLYRMGMRRPIPR